MMPAQLPFDLPHRPSLAREDLIVTNANRMAIAAIDGWPDWPHPVLLLVGPAGAGKSHLATAWAETAGAVRFDGDLPDRASGSFAVVIDDVDRGPHSERSIFDLVNAARLGGGFVLLTARSKPAAMSLSLADLRSRLQAAATVTLDAPDEALLGGVLAKLFADRQIAVDPKLIRYLIHRMERSLDAASRIVAAIDKEALAGKERINRALLQRIMLQPEFAEISDRAAKVADHDSDFGHEEDLQPGASPDGGD